jgi:hypothetical protein
VNLARRVRRRLLSRHDCFRGRSGRANRRARQCRIGRTGALTRVEADTSALRSVRLPSASAIENRPRQACDRQLFCGCRRPLAWRSGTLASCAVDQRRLLLCAGPVMLRWRGRLGLTSVTLVCRSIRLRGKKSLARVKGGLQSDTARSDVRRLGTAMVAIIPQLPYHASSATRSSPSGPSISVSFPATAWTKSFPP